MQEDEQEGESINVWGPWGDSLSSIKVKSTAFIQSTSGQPNIPRGGPRATVNQETVFSCTTSTQREQLVKHILTDGFVLKSNIHPKNWSAPVS